MRASVSVCVCAQPKPTREPDIHMERRVILYDVCVCDCVSVCFVTVDLIKMSCVEINAGISIYYLKLEKKIRF